MRANSAREDRKLRSQKEGRSYSNSAKLWQTPNESGKPGSIKQSVSRKGKADRSDRSQPQDNHYMTLEEYIVNHLTPQLSATKKIVIRYKGEITDEIEVSDDRARLRAVRTALWLLGAFPSHVRRPGELRHVRLES